MYQTVQILAVTLLLIGTASPRAEQKPLITDNLFEADKRAWQAIDHQMSPHRYEAATHNNQRLLRKSAQRLLENGLTSFGVPKQGIAFTGAVIGLAIDGGKLNLNESKTMALELDEVTNEDRALSLRLKLRW